MVERTAAKHRRESDSPEYTENGNPSSAEPADEEFHDAAGLEPDADRQPSAIRSAKRRIVQGVGLVVSIGLVSPILAAPAIVLIITRNSAKVDQLLRADIICFFFWLSGLWAIALMTHFFVEATPGFVAWGSQLFLGLVSERLQTRLQWYSAMRNQIKAVFITAWAIAGFALAFSFRPYADLATCAKCRRSVADWDSSNDSPTGELLFRTIFRILVCACCFAVIVCIEKFFLQMISIRFHQTAYEDRLKENKYALKVLDKLNEAATYADSRGGVRSKKKKARRSAQMASSPTLEMGLESDESPGTTPLSPGDPPYKAPSAAAAAAAAAPGPSSTSERLAADLTKEIRGNFQGIFKVVSADKLAEEEVDEEADGRNARKLAHRIFEALSQGRRHLLCEDFSPHFKTEAQAKAAFNLFDVDGNGDVSRREMKERVERVYKERSLLKNAVRDLSQVVGKLDKIMLAIGILVFVFCAIIVFGGNLTTLVPLSSIILAGTFVFGSTAKNLFECIIFLFVTHPYDAGDRVLIEGETMIVDNIGVLTTIFKTSNGQQMYAPNSVLSLKNIRNFRRSPPQSESIDISVAFQTSNGTIADLHRRMESFVVSEARDYGKDLPMSVQSIENANKVVLSFFLQHKSNWQDGQKRAERRNKFMYALKRAMEDLEIHYALPTQRLEYTAAAPNSAVPA